MQTIPEDQLKLMSLIGALCSDLGLHDRALAILQQLVLLRGEDPNALVSLALGQSRSGDEAAGLATLRRALERDPLHEMARVMLAIHLHKAGLGNAREPLQAVLAAGQDADALALAESVKEEILTSATVLVLPTERTRRHRYTRIGIEP